LKESAGSWLITSPSPLSPLLLPAAELSAAHPKACERKGGSDQVLCLPGSLLVRGKGWVCCAYFRCIVGVL
jgi:hypothetical protein